MKIGSRLALGFLKYTEWFEKEIIKTYVLRPKNSCDTLVTHLYNGIMVNMS